MKTFLWIAMVAGCTCYAQDDDHYRQLYEREMEKQQLQRVYDSTAAWAEALGWKNPAKRGRKETCITRPGWNNQIETVCEEE